MEEEKKKEVTEKKVDNDYVKLIRSNERKKATIIILIFALVVMALFLVLMYCGIVNIPSAKKCKDEPPSVETKCDECPKCENNEKECNCPVCTNNLGEKITSLKKIEVTTTPKTVKVGEYNYTLKLNSDNYLVVDDFTVHGIFNMEISGDNMNVYLTDKYLFVTSDGQFDSIIVYVIGEKGESLPNNSNMQMTNFRIVDGYLHATGGGLVSGDNDVDIEHKDLIIKYIDNTLIVTYAK